MRHERFEPLSDAEIEAAMARARVERARVFHAAAKHAFRALGAAAWWSVGRFRGVTGRAAAHRRAGANGPSTC